MENIIPTLCHTIYQLIENISIDNKFINDYIQLMWKHYPDQVTEILNDKYLLISATENNRNGLSNYLEKILSIKNNDEDIHVNFVMNVFRSEYNQIELLLKNGMNPSCIIDSYDYHYYPVLMASDFCDYTEDFIKIFELLIKYGLNISIETDDGYTLYQKLLQKKCPYTLCIMLKYFPKLCEEKVQDLELNLEYSIGHYIVKYSHYDADDKEMNDKWLECFKLYLKYTIENKIGRLSYDSWGNNLWTYITMRSENIRSKYDKVIKDFYDIYK